MKHIQALDELYVHHLLRKEHADVRYEEGGRGPDFRIYTGGGAAVAAIEVCSLFQREAWTLKQGVHDRLADEVCSRLAADAGYFVDLRIRSAPHEPPPRKFTDWLRREVLRLPPHEEVAGNGPHPRARYDQDGVVIDVTFMPMRKNARTKSNPDGRIVGIGAVKWDFVSGDRLRDCVADKAGSRYDTGETPFVVAVGVHDWSYSEGQVLTGLYGRAAEDQPRALPLRGDGLFGLDKERPDGRHRRLSAVVAFGDHLSGVSVYANPYADRTAPADLIPGARRFGPVANPASTCLAWQ